MSINVKSLVDDMVAGAMNELADLSGEKRAMVIGHLSTIAHTIAEIEEKLLAGLMSESEAKHLFNFYMKVTENVLLEAEGMLLVSAERLMNSALCAIASIVNGILHFELITIEEQ